MATKKTAKKTEIAKTSRMVLIGNEKYGLYIGRTSATDAEILVTKSARCTDVRHVAQWYGKTGGITSLAAFGPCGSRASESRIGAPAPSALLMGIVNVYDLTSEAVAAFAAIVAK